MRTVLRITPKRRVVRLPPPPPSSSPALASGASDVALAPPETRSALVCMARRAGATATAVAKMVASSAPERRMRCILCLDLGVEGHAAELQASDWVSVVKARGDFFGDLLR